MAVRAGGERRGMFSIDRGDDGTVDPYDTFEPAHIPEPGSFLEDADVLDGDDHVAFHRLTRGLFEERGVYDVTFGYNLARLTLDRRHESAGFRYARERRGSDDAHLLLRAEFTPTTPFCPQSKDLSKGAFRAWNALSERHEYDTVVVRVNEMHQESASINAELATLDPNAVDPGDATTERPVQSDDDSVGSFESPF
jgi:hypothetical protein